MWAKYSFKKCTQTHAITVSSANAIAFRFWPLYVYKAEVELVFSVTSKLVSSSKIKKKVFVIFDMLIAA